MRLSRTLPSLSLLIAGIGLAVNGYSQSFLTNGLVAYYPFNGNANDASGNGLNGLVFGAVLTTNRFGIPNGAYYFDGVSAYITTPAGSSEFTNDFTASVWFNAFDITNGGPSLLYEQNTSFFLQVVGAACGCDPSDIGRLDAFAYEGQASVMSWLLQSPQQIPTSTYLQAVVVKGGTNVTMYLDGQPVAETAFTNATTQAGQLLMIGRESSTNSGGTAFHGVIDDVRIYNRALSTNEVAQLYAIESAPPCVPRSATATATLVNGFAVGATITDGGCGYTNTPGVFISGGGGAGAAATAVVSNGVVVNLIFTEAGAGYTNAPNIYIYSPLGVQLSVIRAVKPSFTGLVVGTTYYQLQVSTDLNTWTNSGAPFKATNPVVVYPTDFAVDEWDQLFFRLVP